MAASQHATPPWERPMLTDTTQFSHDFIDMKTTHLVWLYGMLSLAIEK